MEHEAKARDGPPLPETGKTASAGTEVAPARRKEGAKPMKETTQDMTGEEHEERRRISPFGILLDVELVIVVLLVCAFVVPQLFGFVPDVVLSPSMEPQVPAGSVAFVNENVGAGQLKVGDIAVYRPDEGKQVMHRVVGIDDGTFTFQGDANVRPDADRVTAGDIVGSYMFHIPQIGYAYVFFDTHRVIIIVAIVVANLLVYALCEIYRVRRQRRDDQIQGKPAGYAG